MTLNSLLFSVGILTVAASGALSWLPSRPARLTPEASLEIQRESEQRGKLLEALGKDLTLWTSLSLEDKFDAVQTVFNAMSEQSQVKIKKSPVFYVERIDERVDVDASMKAQPLDKVLMVIAIMEYDFATGEDPDVLAKRFLGPALYESNRKRREGSVR